MSEVDTLPSNLLEKIKNNHGTNKKNSDLGSRSLVVEFGKAYLLFAQTILREFIYCAHSIAYFALCNLLHISYTINVS